MSTSAQLLFIASLREDEEEHAGDVPLVFPVEAEKSMPDSDFEKVKILYFGPETFPVSRNDILTYKSQLGGGFKQRTAEPAAHSLPAAPHRSFGLSDESIRTAGIDKEKLEGVISHLKFETQPLARAWAVPGGNLEALQTQYYNYGLNEKLFREYLEHQISIRLNRAQRSRVEVQHSQPQGEPQKSLYVLGFPQEWSQTELASLFSRFGLVESAAVIGKKVGPHSKGAGFVNFSDVESALRAVEATHGRPIPGREDCRLTVNFSRPKPPRAP